MNNRKLTRQTIKPVLKFIGNWGNDIYSLNTSGADFYEFTLDTYDGHNSWQGGFSYGFDDCYNYNDKPNEQYAISLKTGDVYDLETKSILFSIK